MTDNIFSLLTKDQLDLLEDASKEPVSFSMEPPEFVSTWAQVVGDFADRVIVPVARDYDEREEFPFEVVQEAAKEDIYGVLPLLLGQAEKSGLFLPEMVRELFKRDPGCGMAIMGSALPAAAIQANGTPAQVLEWVPQLYGTPNDVKIGALCVTEERAGSDVSQLRTRAKRDGDDYVINGSKIFITNGSVADNYVVVATVDPDLGARGHASFMVPRDTKGVEPGKKSDKCGIKASNTSPVYFDDVRIPCKNLLGDEEKLEEKLARAREVLKNPNAHTGGKNPAMATFEATRPLVGAMAVGLSEAALEYVINYTRTREVFGSTLDTKEITAVKFANMATEIECSRLLVWQAAWMARNGKKFTRAEGSMSKLKASETAVNVTLEAIQIMGGYGFMREHPVERWHRDSIIMRIFEGTSEIQQLDIAGKLTGQRIR